MSYLMGSFPEELMAQLGPYQTGLSETMQAPSQDPMEIYKKLFGLFAPEFNEPSDEWREKNRRDAILAAGAAMLGGGDFMEGMGRAGQAYGQQMYGREQDEQRRLDLRSREEALSKYRAASASGIGDKEVEDYVLAEDPVHQRWLAQQNWRRENPEPDKPFVPMSPEEEAERKRMITFREAEAAKHLPSAPRPEGPESASQMDTRAEVYYNSYIAPMLPELGLKASPHPDFAAYRINEDDSIHYFTMHQLLISIAAHQLNTDPKGLSIEDALEHFANRTPVFLAPDE